MTTSVVFRSLLALGLANLSPVASATHEPLVVVEDQGGSPTRPYYDALDLPARPGAVHSASPPASAASLPDRRYSEADMLPVRSELLAPGPVERRAAELSGLTQPMFLVGDDERSRQWLQQRLPELRRLKAVGVVVRVQSIERLHALRRLAPGVTLSPVSGDDLARRLGLRHYPALLTPTGIEQ